MADGPWISVPTCNALAKKHTDNWVLQYGYRMKFANLAHITNEISQSFTYKRNKFSIIVRMYIQIHLFVGMFSFLSFLVVMKHCILHIVHVNWHTRSIYQKLFEPCFKWIRLNEYFTIQHVDLIILQSRVLFNKARIVCRKQYLKLGKQITNIE